MVITQKTTVVNRLRRGRSSRVTVRFSVNVKEKRTMEIMNKETLENSCKKERFAWKDDILVITQVLSKQQKRHEKKE